MRTLKFHYAAAWNFLPFGPDGVELHFDKMGKVVFVRGENRDVKPIDTDLPSDEARISSNGTGKSTLQEILCWTFYGKTIKNPSKIKADGVIHNLIGGKCRTAVVVDKYRIERGRKPNFLRLWESDKHEWNDSTELTLGDMRVTQKKIEEIIGLSYEAFVNICVFADDQSSCFLECDTPTKREIVENLLSLSIYRERHEIANTELKAIKTNIKTLGREYETLLGVKSDAEVRIEKTVQKEKDWKLTKQTELKALVQQVKDKTLALKGSDTGAALLAYQTAQESIKEITPKIDSLEKKQDTRRQILSEVREKETVLKDKARELTEKVQDCQRVIKEQQSQIKKHEQFVADLGSNEPGTHCKKCYGVIDEANYKHACREAGTDIEVCKAVVKQEVQKAALLTEEVKVLKVRQDKIKESLADKEKELTDGDASLKKLRTSLVAASQVREPKADSAELLLQQQIESLKEQARNKKAEADGPSPFVDILANDQKELEKHTKTCAGKESEIKSAERRVPYYEYWVKAYGDKGIRKWVVDGIIPALNGKIAYWLQFLIDNKISLKFDNELNELIERNPPDGDPYIYHAMSAGQRRRLNLAVSQAFAHIMMISTGTVPSVVFLDEVTTNIDPLGVHGIYNMICELAEEKQVFVTTHDADLIRMLHGADTVSLRHESGITKLVK